MTTQTCACQPGTEANGWHEHRCTECLDEERRTFGAVFAFHAQRNARIRDARAKG